MKSKNRWALGVIVALVALVLLLNYGMKGSSSEEMLSESRVLEILTSEASGFCNYLQEEAINSGYATCRHSQEYVLVEEFSSILSDLELSEYTLEENAKGYLITVDHRVVYGTNTRTGHLKFSINVDKGGEVISTEYPEDTSV